MEGREVVLEEEDSTLFSILVAWLYTKSLVLPMTFAGFTSNASKAPAVRLVAGKAPAFWETAWPDEILVDVYSLARCHGVHDLANCAMSTLMAQSTTYQRTASLRAVSKAFESRYVWRPLQVYLVDEASVRLIASPETGSEGWDLFPAGHTNRIMRQISKPGTPLDIKWFASDQCRYHLHEDETDRRECKAKGPNAKAGCCHWKDQVYSLLNDMGTVVVGSGDGAQTFAVHKELICRQSEYFRGAFRGGFVEDRTGIVSLDDEDPATFARFLEWRLYNGRLDLHESGSALLQTPLSFSVDNKGSSEVSYQSNADVLARLVQETRLSKSQRHPSSAAPASAATVREAEEHQQAARQRELQHGLVDLYILADCRQIGKLKSDIMDFIIASSKTLPLEQWQLSSSIQRVSTALSPLPISCSLCRYLIDEAACTWNGDLKDIGDLAQLPSEFLGPTMKLMLERNAAKGSAAAWPSLLRTWK